MDILWKQVTNIPALWNKPELIEQHANFVNCCSLDLGQKVVFVDESGFDLHLGCPFGYTPSGTVPFCVFSFSFLLYFELKSFFYCRPACCPQSCTKGKADNINCCLIDGRI
jgi:hypothetical protein